MNPEIHAFSFIAGPYSHPPGSLHDPQQPSALPVTSASSLSLAGGVLSPTPNSAFVGVGGIFDGGLFGGGNTDVFGTAPAGGMFGGSAIGGSGKSDLGIQHSHPPSDVPFRNDRGNRAFMRPELQIACHTYARTRDDRDEPVRNERTETWNVGVILWRMFQKDVCRAGVAVEGVLDMRNYGMTDTAAYHRVLKQCPLLQQKVSNILFGMMTKAKKWFAERLWYIACSIFSDNLPSFQAIEIEMNMARTEYRLLCLEERDHGAPRQFAPVVGGAGAQGLGGAGPGVGGVGGGGVGAGGVGALLKDGTKWGRAEWGATVRRATAALDAARERGQVGSLLTAAHRFSNIAVTMALGDGDSPNAVADFIVDATGGQFLESIANADPVKDQFRYRDVAFKWNAASGLTDTDRLELRKVVLWQAARATVFPLLHPDLFNSAKKTATAPLATEQTSPTLEDDPNNNMGGGPAKAQIKKRARTPKKDGDINVPGSSPLADSDAKRLNSRVLGSKLEEDDDLGLGGMDVGGPAGNGGAAASSSAGVPSSGAAASSAAVAPPAGAAPLVPGDAADSMDAQNGQDFSQAEAAAAKPKKVKPKVKAASKIKAGLCSSLTAKFNFQSLEDETCTDAVA